MAQRGSDSRPGRNTGPSPLPPSAHAISQSLSSSALVTLSQDRPSSGGPPRPPLRTIQLASVRNRNPAGARSSRAKLSLTANGWDGAASASTSGEQTVLVFTADEIRRHVRDNIGRNIDQIFGFFYVQMFIAAFVAIVGIINTLVISVWDRRREIGIIRAVGGTRRQVARMILLEAAVLSVVGLAIGIAKSVFDIYFMSHTAARVFAGLLIPFYFPAGLIALSVPVLCIVALISASWPARLAARTNVAAAIASE